MSRTSKKALTAALFASSLLYAPALAALEITPPVESVREKWVEPPVYLRKEGTDADV